MVTDNDTDTGTDNDTDTDADVHVVDHLDEKCWPCIFQIKVSNCQHTGGRGG